MFQTTNQQKIDRASAVLDTRSYLPPDPGGLDGISGEEKPSGDDCYIAENGY